MFIETFEEVINLLKQDQVLYTFQKGQVIFCQRKDDQVLIYGPQARYFLTLGVFVSLFKGQSFFLYQSSSKEEDISLQKDEEYYRWKNK